MFAMNSRSHRHDRHHDTNTYDYLRSQHPSSGAKSLHHQALRRSRRFDDDLPNRPPEKHNFVLDNGKKHQGNIVNGNGRLDKMYAALLARMEAQGRVNIHIDDAAERDSHQASVAAVRAEERLRAAERERQYQRDERRRRQAQEDEWARERRRRELELELMRERDYNAAAPDFDMPASTSANDNVVPDEDENRGGSECGSDGTRRSSIALPLAIQDDDAVNSLGSLMRNRQSTVSDRWKDDYRAECDDADATFTYDADKTFTYDADKTFTGADIDDPDAQDRARARELLAYDAASLRSNAGSYQFVRSNRSSHFSRSDHQAPSIVSSAAPSHASSRAPSIALSAAPSVGAESHAESHCSCHSGFRSTTPLSVAGSSRSRLSVASAQSSRRSSLVPGTHAPVSAGAGGGRAFTADEVMMLLRHAYQASADGAAGGEPAAPTLERLQQAICRELSGDADCDGDDGYGDGYGRGRHHSHGRSHREVAVDDYHALSAAAAAVAGPPRDVGRGTDSRSRCTDHGRTSQRLHPDALQPSPVRSRSSTAATAASATSAVRAPVPATPSPEPIVLPPPSIASDNAREFFNLVMRRRPGSAARSDAGSPRSSSRTNVKTSSSNGSSARGHHRDSSLMREMRESMSLQRDRMGGSRRRRHKRQQQHLSIADATENKPLPPFPGSAQPESGQQEQQEQQQEQQPLPSPSIERPPQTQPQVPAPVLPSSSRSSLADAAVTPGTTTTTTTATTPLATDDISVAADDAADAAVGAPPSRGSSAPIRLPELPALPPLPMFFDVGAKRASLMGRNGAGNGGANGNADTNANGADRGHPHGHGIVSIGNSPLPASPPPSGPLPPVPQSPPQSPHEQGEQHELRQSAHLSHTAQTSPATNADNDNNTPVPCSPKQVAQHTLQPQHANSSTVNIATSPNANTRYLDAKRLPPHPPINPAPRRSSLRYTYIPPSAVSRGSTASAAAAAAALTAGRR